MKYNIIVFNKEVIDEQSLFGFKIVSSKAAKSYIKAVKKLESNCSTYEMLGDDYEYQRDDFDVHSIVLTEIKALSKLFDFKFDATSEEQEPIGAFPLAMEQYYDEGLDYEADEDYSDEDDEY